MMKDVDFGVPIFEPNSLIQERQEQLRNLSLIRYSMAKI